MAATRHTTHTRSLSPSPIRARARAHTHTHTHTRIPWTYPMANDIVPVQRQHVHKHDAVTGNHGHPGGDKVRFRVTVRLGLGLALD